MAIFLELGLGIASHLEHFGHGPDHAVAFVIVSQAKRHDLDHVLGVLTLDELLVEGPGDILDRCTQVVDGVQDELQLAPLGTHNQVVALRRAAKRIVHDAIDHQHADHQGHAEGHGEAGEC